MDISHVLQRSNMPQHPIQSADHATLISHGNVTYSQLYMAHSALLTKYNTLQ
jgi:hypothetical protein